MFIKKIFENQIDESVHRQFVRFGKGTYNQRAIFNVIKQAEKIRISSSFELSNDMIEFISTLGTSFSVNGVLLSKENIEGFEFKKKGGLLTCTVNREMKAYELREMVKKVYFALLDCSAPGISLKIKKTLPKPGKSGETKVNDKFCQLELDKRFWLQFKEEFLFDLPQEFKKARIEHTYIIKELILPKGETDFEKMRIMAKRKGKIIRKIVVDGKESIKEKDFEV